MKHINILTIIFSLSISSAFTQFDDTPRSIVSQPMDEGNRREMTFSIQNGVSEPTGNIVWTSDFESTNNWVATGLAEMNPDNTFKLTTSEGTWYFDEWTSSTSGGNYALFTNGDPTNETHVNGTFHLTYDSIFDLSALSSAIIEFEQYGARYYDKQLVEVSTDLGTTWQIVGTNDDIFRLTYDGGVPYPASMLRQYSITTAISGNPSQVMFRFTVDYNDDATVFGKSYGWFIDDVKIREGFEYDLKLVQAFTSVGENLRSYTKLNMNQILPSGSSQYMNFGAIVKNEGSLPVEVNLKVTSSNGIERISPQSILLQPNEQDTIAVFGENGIEMSQLSNNIQYDFHFELVTVEVMENTWNDTLNVPFELFNNFYNSRDSYNGFPESKTGTAYDIQNGEGWDACIGVVYDVFESAAMITVGVGIPNLSVDEFQQMQGSSVFAQIYKLNGSSLEFLWMSMEHEIQIGDLGTIVNLYTPENPAYVNSGDSVVVFACSFGGARVPIQLSGLLPFENVIGKLGATWFYTAQDEYYQNMTFAPVIRVVTTSTESINENELTTKKIHIYPNPSSETTTASFTLTEQSTVSIDVVDVSGKIVSRIKETKFPEGEQQISLSTGHLSSGVYTVVMYVNDRVYSEKLVVE